MCRSVRKAEDVAEGLSFDVQIAFIILVTCIVSHSLAISPLNDCISYSDSTCRKSEFLGVTEVEVGWMTGEIALSWSIVLAGYSVTPLCFYFQKRIVLIFLAH